MTPTPTPLSVIAQATAPSKSRDDYIYYLSTSSIAYSFRHNPRLLEDATHPLWTFQTQESSLRYTLIPTNQLKIYVSARDNSLADSFTSTRTMPDSNARGVVTDFALILPVFKEIGCLLPGVEIAEDMMNSILQKFGEQWVPGEWYKALRKIELSHLLVPLLTELKQPITRSAVDIKAYLKCIFGRLRPAKDQAISQAWCLFSSVRFSEQDYVILKVGAGEWWSFCAITREQMEIRQRGRTFIMEQDRKTVLKSFTGRFQSHEGTGDVQRKRKAKAHHRDDIAGKKMADVKGKAITREARKNAIMIIHKEEDETETRHQAAKEKGKRQTAREAAVGPAHEPFPVFTLFKQNAYSNDELQLAQLTAEKSTDKLNHLQFDVLPERDNEAEVMTVFTNFEWSPATRVGSNISNQWERAINRRLKEIVEEEHGKVTRVQDEIKQKTEELLVRLRTERANQLRDNRGKEALEDLDDSDSEESEESEPDYDDPKDPDYVDHPSEEEDDDESLD